MKKRKLKFDNIFIAVSILFLGTLFIIYSTRFIHYYRIEHKKLKAADVITFSEYLIDNDTNLKKEGNKYIYTGNDVNNYVTYSGLTFRIVSIEDGSIKLVTDETITSLVMDYDDSDYQDTYTNIWLNDIKDDLNSGKFASILQDKNKYLVNTKTCIDTLDNYETKKCKKYNDDYLIGILSIDEYMNALANNSYLNNGTYFWLSNKNKDGNYWYVFDQGGIADKSKTETTYHIYGIRPTITLNKNVAFIDGNGTKENPYYFALNDNKLLVNRNTGEYVNYGGYTWRIMGFDKNQNVKLVLADKLKVNGELIELAYDQGDSAYLNTIVYNYLNKTFYNSLKNKELVVKHTFDDGMYNNSTKYDYRAIYNKSTECYVGLLNIGDLFINDVDNVYLATRSTVKMEYSIQNKKLFVDLITKKLNIRPVIYLDGKLNVKGTGTKKDPFEIGGTNE